MRVADPNSPGNAVPAENATQPSATHARQDNATSAAAESDRAELSGVAGRVSELLRADAANHAEHIGELKEAVASGTYSVDSAALSHSLVDAAISSSSDTPTE